ncbi:snurportin-1 isoform X2 [Tachypleus tridentatus]|uniref:snurportin-1 isoform X2 n=2 Tax=Tachypleus tridentatus TaxID=6853 RepID=UPI003FD5121E
MMGIIHKRHLFLSGAAAILLYNQCMSEQWSRLKLFIQKTFIKLNITMDDLISCLATSVTVSSTPNDTAAPHPRFALYKPKYAVPPQEERRNRFLEAQKKKRYDYVLHARKLAEGSWSVHSEEEEKTEEEMEWVGEPRKFSRSYRNQLMLSEWLVEVPSDLSEEWLLVLCPEGKRNLVIASRGHTRAFTKSGYHINTFPSELPGGNRKQRKHAVDYTLLDCVFNEKEKTFFILDIMCWRSNPVFDSETTFRFWWLHTKISEIPEVQQCSKLNPYKFVPLPSYSCDHEVIQNTLWSNLPFSCKLDGLLFYHKRTLYTAGLTPLVGWLKPYMLPEMLQIPVPETLTSDKPPTYVCMEQQLPKAFKKHRDKKDIEQQEKVEETISIQTEEMVT